MTRKSAGAAAETRRRGWAELAAGRWAAARETFEAELAAAETAETLEGLSWAAWWLDDGPTVFETRERAYRLYRERGDAASAARMATWLATDHFDFHGAGSVAAGWLRRAERLLDPLEHGPEHGWLAFFDGYFAHAAGDAGHARERAVSAAEAGRRFGVPDLEMLGLGLEGAALVASGEVDAGMRRLDEATATALAEEASIPISSAWTCCFLVTACTSTLDMERASEWCERIADFAEQYGSRYMLAFCRSEYGTVYIWQGRWGDAEAMLQAAADDYAQSRPAFLHGPRVGLAELRRRQGRLDEAEALLDEAGPSPAALTCRAALALDRDDAATAVELAERLLRQVPGERVLERAPALATLVRAQVRRGAIEAANDALAELRSLADAVGTSPLRAHTDLAEGLVAAARGEHEPARTLLEDAVDRFDRSGAPFETAQARIALAQTLAALGRDAAARAEASAAAAALDRLGARAEATRARKLVTEPDDVVAPLAELTRREREVVALLAQGSSNREIAALLVVSEHTVHRHVTNILRKLGVSSRTAAASLAIRAGIDPDAAES